MQIQWERQNFLRPSNGKHCAAFRLSIWLFISIQLSVVAQTMNHDNASMMLHKLLMVFELIEMSYEMKIEHTTHVFFYQITNDKLECLEIKMWNASLFIHLFIHPFQISGLSWCQARCRQRNDHHSCYRWRLNRMTRVRFHPVRRVQVSGLLKSNFSFNSFWMFAVHAHHVGQ